MLRSTGKPGEHPHRNGAEHDADDEAEGELANDVEHEVREPERRIVDPGDEADRERDRDRVVQARLGLQRARDPLPDVREPERREDRGRVGRGDDRPEEHRLEPREVEQRVRRGARKHRGRDNSRRRQQACRDGHAPEPAPRRGEPALVEDRRQAGDPDGPRELGVVEVDSAGTIRAEQHAEHEKGDERRNPDTRGADRDGHADREDPANEQEERAGFHASIFPGRAGSRGRPG